MFLNKNKIFAVSMVAFGLLPLGIINTTTASKAVALQRIYVISANLDAADAPGQPTADDGYTPPKKWDGKKVRNPNGSGAGWPDAKGDVWVPTGPGGDAHGGPHWDVQTPGGKYRNVYPGGKVR